MREAVGFLRVCTVGLVVLLGCNEGGNECMEECCRNDGQCTTGPVDNGTPCDGLAGVCVEGLCQEDPCPTGCIGDACFDDTCDYVAGTCGPPPVPKCDAGNICSYVEWCTPDEGCGPVVPREDGQFCVGGDARFANYIEWGDYPLGIIADQPWLMGSCQDGTCAGPCNPASEETYECPDGFNEIDLPTGARGAPIEPVCCPGDEYCVPASRCQSKGTDTGCVEECCRGGNCTSRQVDDGTACDFNGVAGVCVEGVCQEDPCADERCDDDNACTSDTCASVPGLCVFTSDVECYDLNPCTWDSCDPSVGCVFESKPDGTYCCELSWLFGCLIPAEGGVCQDGVCVAP